MNPENFGRNLKSILNTIGMQQAELAERAKLSRATISQVLNNERDPSLTVVLKIMSVIPVKFEILMKEEACKNEKSEPESKCQ